MFVVSKEASPYTGSSSFSSMLSFSFNFTFRSKIHFELVFMKGVRSVSRFIILPCGCPVVPAPLVERLSLLHCVVLGPLSMTIFM